MLLYKYFARFLRRFVVNCKDFHEILQTYVFPENLSVAAASRCKVLKILISINVTVYMQGRRLLSYSIYAGPQTTVIQYICRAADYGHTVYMQGRRLRSYSIYAGPQTTVTQYICRAADYGLRTPKMLSVLNGNLIKLKW